MNHSFFCNILNWNPLSNWQANISYNYFVYAIIRKYGSDIFWFRFSSGDKWMKHVSLSLHCSTLQQIRSSPKWVLAYNPFLYRTYYPLASPISYHILKFALQKILFHLSLTRKLYRFSRFSLSLSLSPSACFCFIMKSVIWVHFFRVPCKMFVNIQIKD